MTTVRALTSGVTGMLANQLAMDVSANNVANVNTPGFKGSRATFGSNLIQTLFSGSAPGNSLGGSDPRQVGLGVQTTSVEVDMRQGAIQSTGRNLDLAIQGDGFFEVSDGTRRFYTRVGNFGLDANNDLVHLGTGYRVLGTSFNLDGSQTGTSSDPINVPVEAAFPPSRTEEVVMQGNLSSETEALRGGQTQSIYQVRSTLTGQIVSESTPFTDLNIFRSDTVVGSPTDTVTMSIFGTKPDGEHSLVALKLIHLRRLRQVEMKVRLRNLLKA